MAREGSTASDARDRRRHRPKDAMWRRFGRYRRETCPGVGVPLAFANKEWWSTAEVPKEEIGGTWKNLSLIY